MHFCELYRVTFLRRIWYRFSRKLPDTLREYIIKRFWESRERMYSSDADLSVSEIGLGAMLKDVNSRNLIGGKNLNNLTPVAPSADSNVRNQDGMRDYPTTRPHLAFDYLGGLVRWLAESDYTVMSYNDLSRDFSHGEEGIEFQDWIKQAEEESRKAVLLQYDVDARPDISTEMIKLHMQYGVPANVMIFREKIFDWKLKRDGIIEVDDTYQLDFDILAKFASQGGVIGYHCNAYDRSGDNMERAIEIFHDDIDELRKYIDIKFFSMHGGHVTSSGNFNGNMQIAPYLKKLGLTWVHNGHSVYFHSNWADGSASNPRYRTECSDPLDFIASTKSGERCRLLFHPQYYNDQTDTHFDFPILQDQGWVYRTRDIVESGQFEGKSYWHNRYSNVTDSISRFDELYDFPDQEYPLFVNGMSRSGTTLMVSMFDVRPDAAMAYESYPRYLYVPSDGGVLTVEEYIYTYQTLMNYPDVEVFKLLDRPPLRNLLTFAAVTSWTGMNAHQTGELLRTYLVKHHRVADALEALKIVAASARFKQRQQQASFWGSKCQGNFEDYFTLWPEARLVYIMRNGLDILASQKVNGAFNPDAVQLGKNWRTQYDRFMKYKNSNPEFKIAMVRYEDLVSDAEATSIKLCQTLDMEYHPQMIKQHEVKTTLAENPRGQLSAERVQQPIDRSSINRWKMDLNKQEIKQFLKGAGGRSLFEENGFDCE